MSNKDLLNSLIELGRVLTGLNEIGWFHRLGGLVEYQRPEHSELVRSDVDHVMGGLSILYLFAIFESYFDQNLWKKYIKGPDEKILRAYRHVRHSIAHGHHGKRVPPRTKLNQEESDAFDEAIKKGFFHPTNIITLDTTSGTITINPSVGIHLKEFMIKVVQDATAQAAITV